MPRAATVVLTLPLILAPALIAQGDADPTPLEVGAPVGGTLGAGEARSYTFEAEADRFVLGYADQRSLRA